MISCYCYFRVIVPIACSKQPSDVSRGSQKGQDVCLILAAAEDGLGEMHHSGASLRNNIDV